LVSRRRQELTEIETRANQMEQPLGSRKNADGTFTPFAPTSPMARNEAIDAALRESVPAKKALAEASEQLKVQY
jgi:hypothetical protein